MLRVMLRSLGQREPEVSVTARLTAPHHQLGSLWAFQ
jgi:hypothetical protein